MHVVITGELTLGCDTCRMFLPLFLYRIVNWFLWLRSQPVYCTRISVLYPLFFAIKSFSSTTLSRTLLEPRQGSPIEQFSAAGFATSFGILADLVGLNCTSFPWFWWFVGLLVYWLSYTFCAMAEANLTPNISGSPAHGLPPTEILREGVLTRAQTSETLRALDLAPVSGERRDPRRRFQGWNSVWITSRLGRCWRTYFHEARADVQTSPCHSWTAPITDTHSREQNS